jgi:hypothetical protein
MTKMASLSDRAALRQSGLSSRSRSRAAPSNGIARFQSASRSGSTKSSVPIAAAASNGAVTYSRTPTDEVESFRFAIGNRLTF